MVVVAVAMVAVVVLERVVASVVLCALVVYDLIKSLTMQCSASGRSDLEICVPMTTPMVEPSGNAN